MHSASADGLANAVTVKNIMKHLQQFQNIANDPVNKGSRGVLEGYNQCLDYVQNTLSKTGCVVSEAQKIEFSFPFEIVTLT